MLLSNLVFNVEPLCNVVVNYCCRDRHDGRCLLQDFPLNPKALSLGELYGEFNLSSNEWADGVLSSIMRQTCAGLICVWLIHCGMVSC